MADQVIRLCGSDLKAISYFKSTLPMLSDKSYNLNNHIKVMSKIKDNEPRAMGDIDYELMYSDEIVTQCREGLLSNALKDKNSIKYNENLNKLVSVILDEETETKQTAKAVKRQESAYSTS